MKAYANGPELRRALGHLFPYREEIWTTIDGRRLKVSEMDESHVRNALRLVLRRRREAWETKLREAKKGN